MPAARLSSPMQQRTALLTVVLLLAAAAGPAVGPASADVALEVVVKTAAGAHVKDAEVTASWDGGERTKTTSSNGRVFIDVPEGANVTIEVDHQNYVRNAPYKLTNATGGEVVVTVWEKASASVQVVDADGPVEDVRVVFRKAGDIVGVHSTDSAGEVESGVIERGTYTLTFFKAGYFRKVVTQTVEDDTSAEVTIERGSVTVEFRVFDDTFDPPKPVQDATISGPAIGSVPTLPDGERNVSVPVNTELTVTVSKDAYETVTRTVVVRESDRQVTIPLRRAPVVDVAIGNERVVVGETVAVTVTDEYGEPLPEATVFLDGAPVGQPDESGTLRVPIESAGEHVLFASVGQLASERVTVTGVESNGGDTPVADVASPTGDGEAESAETGPAGGLDLRSTAIGIAGGLVLAAVLFVVLRFR